MAVAAGVSRPPGNSRWGGWRSSALVCLRVSRHGLVLNLVDNEHVVASLVGPSKVEEDRVCGFGWEIHFHPAVRGSVNGATATAVAAKPAVCFTVRIDLLAPC